MKGEKISENQYQWDFKKPSLEPKHRRKFPKSAVVLGALGMLAFGGYQFFKHNTQSSDAITPTIETSYHIQDTKAELERLSQEDFIVPGNKSSLLDKFKAYQHNKEILLDITKVWAQEVSHIQGNYTDKDQSLEESIIQQYQESQLQHITPAGRTKKSFADAYGASQFTDIAIKDLHEKLNILKQCNPEYAQIPHFSEHKIKSASVQGAIANIGANIAYKKALLELYAQAHLDEEQALRKANSMYHDGEFYASKAFKKAEANNTNNFEKYLGPEGKDYIKGTDEYREIYEDSDQFSTYADMQKAYELMGGKMAYADTISNPAVRKYHYEQVLELSDYLEEQGELFGRAHSLKAQYELARVLQESNPKRALVLAKNVYDNAELTNRANFYKKESAYLMKVLN